MTIYMCIVSCCSTFVCGDIWEVHVLNNSPPCRTSLLHYVPKRIGWRCCGDNCLLYLVMVKNLAYKYSLANCVKGGTNDGRCDISIIYTRQVAVVMLAGRDH
jgi:hypothetical protein